MLVLGDREVEEGTVAVRRHREGDVGTFALERFIAHLADETSARRDAQLVSVDRFATSRWRIGRPGYAPGRSSRWQGQPVAVYCDPLIANIAQRRAL